MVLPSSLSHSSEWVILGPMGPHLPQKFHSLPVLAVDGGAKFHEGALVWVGDADSYEDDIRAPHIFRHRPEKDHSDLALSLSLFVEPRHYKFHFWGFLGGRKDHELMNLGESMKFLENNPESQILLYDDSGKVVIHALGAGIWKFTHVGPFSLGTLKKTTVRMTGSCQYQILNRETLEPLSSFGLSNEASGEIQIEADGAVFVIFPEGK